MPSPCTLHLCLLHSLCPAFVPFALPLYPSCPAFVPFVTYLCALCTFMHSLCTLHAKPLCPAFAPSFPSCPAFVSFSSQGWEIAFCTPCALPLHPSPHRVKILSFAPLVPCLCTLCTQPLHPSCPVFASFVPCLCTQWSGFTPKE